MKLKSLLRFSREIILVLSAYSLYSLGRGFLYEDFAFSAFRNAWDVISFEKSIGIFREAGIQSWLLQNFFGAVVFLNWFYAFGYWTVIGVTSVITYIHDREAYHRFRTVAFLSYGIALVLYASYPLAPPRMIFYEGFIDTIRVWGPGNYYSAANALFYNPYAAMPSMHFGLVFIMGLIFWRCKNRALRLIALLYPATMLMSIVVTANHYLLDAIAAVGVVGLGLVIYKSKILLLVVKPTELDRQYAGFSMKHDLRWPHSF
ncbi:MAG: phosphatase PAP2 family protein [Chloroflexi bacterium]|nr:phosphatase PAP2 family protein [Chloroflexota bacterium]